MKLKRWQRRSLRIAGVIFILLNAIAAMHAWKFSHFAPDGVCYARPQDIPFGTRLRIALTGIDNPRPKTLRLPDRSFREVILQNDKKIVCWYMAPPGIASKGTVILFHGYGGEKSGMLGKAYLLLDAGYNVLLPDFRGAGASEGNNCTIGYKEARDVAACYKYVQASGERKIILLGTSMGAAAILKYLDDGGAQPAAVIIECPFGTMYQTVSARFKMMHLPTFPGVALLTFWGGTENGFWAFHHNPADYARSVKCPSLLVFGELDDRVSRAEIDAVYSNLPPQKQLCLFPQSGHNDYLSKYPHEWDSTVRGFLSRNVR